MVNFSVSLRVVIVYQGSGEGESMKKISGIHQCNHLQINIDHLPCNFRCLPMLPNRPKIIQKFFVLVVK